MKVGQPGTQVKPGERYAEDSVHLHSTGPDPYVEAVDYDITTPLGYAMATTSLPDEVLRSMPCLLPSVDAWRPRTGYPDSEPGITDILACQRNIPTALAERQGQDGGFVGTSRNSLSWW